MNLNTIFTATAWLISIVSIAVLFHVANADEHEVVLVDGVNIISGQRISFGYRFEGEIQGVFCRAELTDKPEIFCDWSRSTDAESINVSAAFVDNPRDSRNANIKRSFNEGKDCVTFTLVSRKGSKEDVSCR